jgi:hypothetical protein
MTRSVPLARLAAALSMVSALLACAQSVPAPRDVQLGQSTCAKCRNVVTSLDAAAEAVYPDGTVRVYDDLGCMATDPEALRGPAQLYVQLAGGKGWVRVEDITFASPEGTKTPQGYNYLAFPEEESRRLAPDHWARGWNDLVTGLARKR